MSEEGRRRILRVALLGLAVGLAFQGSRGLFETTEGRYAEVAREMVETGAWWTPQLDYRPHWSKPPFTYWTIAGGIEAVGVNAWGARLAHGLALPAGGLVVLWLGTLLYDPRTGYAAGLVFVTSLLPVVASATLSTDFPLALAEAWVAACYWQAIRAGPGRRERHWVAWMWAAAGLSFLIKGPPSLLTPAAITIHAWMGRRRGWRAPRLWSASGFAAFALVGLGWYLSVVLTTPGLLHYFLADEVIGRVATARFHRNPEWYKPPLIYGPPLLLGLGAWLAYLAGFAASRQPPAWRLRAPTTSEGWFLTLWLAVPLVVLSLSRSRLPLYVLPFFPAVVLPFAHALVRRARDRRLPTVAAGVAIGMIALKAVAAHVPSDRDMAALYRALAPQITAHDRVIAVDEPRLYGLEFYLAGALERARLTRTDMDAPALARLLDELSPDRRLLLVIRSGRKAPAGTAAGAPGRVEHAACTAPRTCSARPLSGAYRLVIVSGSG